MATREELGLDATALTRAIHAHLRYSLGRMAEDVGPSELFRAAALAVRDRLVDRILATEGRYRAADAKRLSYLSIEFLIGRSLGDSLRSLGILEACREAAARLGGDLDAALEAEPDAALGNGGLGRLAACFLDSLASLDLPGFGYGLNYEFGLFRQEIRQGAQRETADHWRVFQSPWQVERPDEVVLVPVYGRIEHGQDRQGQYNPMWLDWQLLVGVPHDMPVVGYGGRTVNVLRLFSARAWQEFDMAIFNDGDYVRAVEQKIASETVSKVLYPSDAIEAGRELRLVQEYFLVACALRDIVRRHLRTHADLSGLADAAAIQMNDTHPALAVAELMRILVDERAIPWDTAWETTRTICAYTNHTLMPEALERWPVALLERVLPRHLQIIFEINRRFLQEVAARWPGDGGRLRRMSLVDEEGERQVRMAHLAIVGSHSVNGVSALHSALVTRRLAPDFFALWPERFNNKTNGVTPRRWLLSANPGLAALVTDAVGSAWMTDLERLRGLEPRAEEAAFRERFRAVKRANKVRLGKIIREATGQAVDPDSLFDVQVKRIHEYKRQLLHVLHVIHAYLRLVEDGVAPPVPRTHVFAGKAAPGYWAAKQIIRLIAALGETIGADPRARDWLRVIFLPDYRVSLAEAIVPAADLSEQISTAGTEASGTSNMKFALNGALTVGTLDGATIEIREAVGAENIFIFGLEADAVARLQAEGGYDPRRAAQEDARIRRVLDALASDRFCPKEPGLFRWIPESLLERGDPYFLLADFGEYVGAQEAAGQRFGDPEAWSRQAILNVARMGWFSSDRTVREYARDIWGLTPVAP
jgi:starch phosphorylase